MEFILTKVLMFCLLVPNKCSIREIEENNTTLINVCITSKANRKFPLIEIGAIDMNNQNRYMVYIIDRNCNKI